LGTTLACGNPSCICRQVDTLFRHVWHYFDEIVVSGPDSHDFLERVEGRWPLHESIQARNRPHDPGSWILDMSRVVFHTRTTGVEPLLTFRRKPPPCKLHW